MATTPVNIANYEEFRSQLSEAVNAAPMWRLQAIIRDDQVAVEGDDDDLDSDLGSESESDADAGSQASNGGHEREPANGILEVIPPEVPAARKRVRPRFAQCVHCKEEYDVTENDGGSCYYHPGFPEPDEDALDEHDEWLDEDVNLQYEREKYPDKFYYPCCGRKYLDEECEVGWHEEDTSGLKRRKY